MRMSSFNFNLHHYEEDLSPFGRRVLMLLINRWNTDRERCAIISSRQPTQRFYRTSTPSKILIFDDANISCASPPPRPPPPLPPRFFSSSAVPSAIHGLNPHIHSDEHPRSRAIALVPTSGQMVTAVHHWDRTGNASSEVMLTSMQRASPVGLQHMFDPHPHLRQDADSPPFSPQRLTSRHRDADSPRFSPQRIIPPLHIQKSHQKLPSLHQKLSLLQQKTNLHERLPLPIQEPAHQTEHKEPVQCGMLMDMKEKPQAERKTQPDAMGKRNEERVKKCVMGNRKVKSKTTEEIPKKVKRLVGISKNPFRKHSHAKAVAEWVMAVDPTMPVEEPGFAVTDGQSFVPAPMAEQGPAIALVAEQGPSIAPMAKQGHVITPRPEQTPAALIPRKRKVEEKVSLGNKVVQAQLTNVGGVMKFGRPAATDRADVADNDINVCDENVSDTTSAKKNPKKKFVAPLKSQPTRSVEGASGVAVASGSISTLGTVGPGQAAVAAPEGPEPCPIEPTDREVTQLVPAGTEVVLVLLYSEGRCELHGGGGAAEGLLALTTDGAGGCWTVDGAQGAQAEFMRHVVTRCRVVCFDGKALLKHCRATLELDLHHTMDLHIMDMKVAGCLLSPSSAPSSLAALWAASGAGAASPGSLAGCGGPCPRPSAAALAVSLREVAVRLVDMLHTRRQWTLYQDIEMKVLPIIAAMECDGVPVSLPSLVRLESELSAAVVHALQAAHSAHGAPFAPLAPAAVRVILYDQLQLDKRCNLTVEHTPHNSDKSTSETMLRKLSAAHAHPLPRLILRYRRLHKARATFVHGIRRHTRGDVLTPTWYQCSAATGRITCANPNVQALPKRPLSLDGVGAGGGDSSDVSDGDSGDDTDGDCNDVSSGQGAAGVPRARASVRSVVCARAGYSLLAADYRHAECRLLAWQAGDDTLRQALAADDLFTTLAAHWRNVPESSVTATERARCKRCVYAAVYGCGAARLARILGQDSTATATTTATAKQMLDSFHRRFPALRQWGRRVVRQAAAQGGTARLRSGRALALPHIDSPDAALRARARRQAVNFMVQGAAADLCKLAMIRTQQALAAAGVEARLLLTVHDELVWEVKEGSVRQAAACVREAMERCGSELASRGPGAALRLRVALSHGPHWGRMQPLTLPASSTDTLTNK